MVTMFEVRGLHPGIKCSNSQLHHYHCHNRRENWMSDGVLTGIEKIGRFLAIVGCPEDFVL